MLEPVWQSRLQHEVHRLAVRTERTLRFVNIAGLAAFGVDPSRYEGFDYTATQAIAAATHFLEYDGLIVPSARARRSNLVIFLDRVTAGTRPDVESTEPVDWAAW